jgi:uncharacterized protein (TIGR00369 family)
MSPKEGRWNQISVAYGSCQFVGVPSRGSIVSHHSDKKSVEPAGNAHSERALPFKMPVAKLIGFEIEEVMPGRAIITLQAGPQHSNPMGTLHGGILCDIADAAMGIAVGSTLEPGQSFTTVELKINFFRPVWSTKLTAEGSVLQRGKTTAYVECVVKEEAGKLVAKAASTCMILHGERANGR